MENWPLPDGQQNIQLMLQESEEMTVEVEMKRVAEKPRSSFLLGPPTVLLSFGQTLTGIVLADLIVFRTCLIPLNINATECFMLRTKAGSPEAMELEAKVEPYASIVVMANSMIRSLLPAILSLFLGPWSDRSGRRPLLLVSISGTTVTFVILSAMSDWNIDPWYLLLASIPANIVGGMYTTRLALVCHISDTTVSKNRIGPLALLEASMCCGNVLGGFAGPLIYKYYGYTYVFITATICSIFMLFYAYLWIPETVKITSKEPIRGLFQFSFVKELLASSLAKRDGFNRFVVWLAIAALGMNSLISMGDMVVQFLFTRARLGWDVQQFAYFDAADSVLRITGLCGISLQSRISGVSDTLLAGIGFTSALGAAITKSLAWKSWHMYLAISIGIFSGITIPVMRSIMSKFVPAQDIAKVFSLAALLEILGSLVGPPLYILLYSNYLPPIYPVPVHLLSVSMIMVSILSMACIELLTKNSRQRIVYNPADQDALGS